MHVTIFWSADYNYFYGKMFFFIFLANLFKKPSFWPFEDYGPSSQSGKSLICFLNHAFFLFILLCVFNNQNLFKLSQTLIS